MNESRILGIVEREEARLDGKRLVTFTVHVEEQITAPHFCSENLQVMVCRVCGKNFGRPRRTP